MCYAEQNGTHGIAPKGGGLLLAVQQDAQHVCKQLVLLHSSVYVCLQH